MVKSLSRAASRTDESRQIPGRRRSLRVLAAASARAQDPAPASPPADDPNQCRSCVVAIPGSGHVRVQYGDATMTIMGSVTPIQQQHAGTAAS